VLLASSTTISPVTRGRIMMIPVSVGVYLMSKGYMPKSKSQTHLTPDRVYEMIEIKWGWKKHDMFDPCPVNPDFDGLEIPWKKINYVNAPYEIETLTKFVNKALKEALKGNETVMLLPTNKTDQPWWHRLWAILEKDDIIFFRGRLRFKNDKDNSPNAHVLVRVHI